MAKEQTTFETRNASYEALLEYLNKVFRENADYRLQEFGRETRKVLLVGGAERALQIVGGRIRSTKIEYQWEPREPAPHLTVFAQVEIEDADGRYLALGVGVASTREPRYEKAVADRYNVVAKMAKKRAYVDAVKTGLGLSSVFTQDLEDMEEDAKKLTDDQRRILSYVNAIRKSRGEPMYTDYEQIPPEIVEKVKRRFEEKEGKVYDQR